MSEGNVLPYESPRSRDRLSRVLFGVVVRTAGLVISLYGAYVIVFGIVAKLLGFAPSATHTETI